MPGGSSGNETRSIYYREEPLTPDPSPFENWSDDSPDEKLFGLPPGISTPAKEEATAKEDSPVEPEPAAAFEPVVEPASTPEPMEQEVELSLQQHRGVLKPPSVFQTILPPKLQSETMIWFDDKVGDIPPRPEPTPAPMEIPEGDGLTSVLTPTMQQLVDSSLSVCEDHKFLGHGGFNLSGKSIHTLREGQWLDDAVINSYLNMIQTCSDRHGYPSLLFFVTFHYTFLDEDRPEFLLKSLTKTNMRGYKYLFFPIHLGNHWGFAYASTKTRRLYYLDSVYGYNKGMAILGKLQKYIYLEEKRLKGDNPLFPATPFRLTVYSNAPQQTNGVDCGVFLLANA